MLVRVSEKKEILNGKVDQLESLLKEITRKIGVMAVEKKYHEYFNNLKNMLEIMNKSQNAVRYLDQQKYTI